MHRLRTFPRTIRSVNLWFNLHVFYPAKRFLTLYHFTGLVMLLSALSLVTQPAISVVKLDALIGVPVTLVLAWLFTICGSILLVRPVSEAGYKTCLLPMYLFASVSVWYAVTGQAGTWAGVITQVTIIGLFWIASTNLPKEGGHDTDAPGRS